MNKTFFFIIVIILILLGAYFFLYHPLPSTLQSSVSTTTSTIGLSIESKTVSEGSNTSTYTIDARYPVVSGLSSSTIQTKINKSISDFILGEISNFKEDVQSNPDQTMPEGSGQSTLAISYATTTSPDESLLSFIITEEFYSAGAAHPGTQIDTLNFDMSSGNLLTLNDLFINNYLNVLSDYSRNSLVQQLGDNSTEQQINEGTDPQTPDNFKSFVLETDGFHIIFNEYQVAAYAAGRQEVVIPYSELKSVINPTGVLGTSAQQ